jgi:aspartyl-tRNA(Asn)/glutamyl-tRNA(Gln) amidotransferase subunit A
METRELCFSPISEQADLIRRKEISPVELLSAFRQRIERVEKRVNAFITLMPQRAMRAARAAEKEILRGVYRGPLHGVPIALKDLFYTKGIRTTAGSRILKDFVPQEAATSVVLLKRAGAVLLGKTNMHEFAFGPIGTNPHYGDVRNPWDIQRVSGGSSGGSAAAVAAGMCSAALGSDTGGSIRIPAAFCGVVGLKPTYGRISKFGVIPLAWSLDHVGPLCRSAEDAAILLAVLAGGDPKDPTCREEPVPDFRSELRKDISKMKIAVLQEYATAPMESQVLAGFQEALRTFQKAGVRIEEISLPEVKYATGAATAILWPEAASYHEQYLRTRMKEYGQDVQARLGVALLVAATDYVKGQRVRRMLLEKFQAILKKYDGLLSPTEPITAPKLDQQFMYLGGKKEIRDAVAPRLTRLFNLIGLPAVSVPCGFSSDGLPMGLQIVSDHFAEGKMLRIAHFYQQHTDWHLRIPPIAGPSA